MGRSVSVPSGAVNVAYRDVMDLHDPWEWEDFLGVVQELAMINWPTVWKADRWIGREDHVIAENKFCEIGVSEYCGVASIWMLPKENSVSESEVNLARHWVEKVSSTFHKEFGEYQRIGVMSNGESVYTELGELI